MAIFSGCAKLGLAQIDAYVKVLTIGDETKYYGAIYPFLRPGNTWLPFVTASVSSQDGLFRTQTEGNLWAYPENEPLFATSEALVDAMQQPYTILLDEGLPSQRLYHMNFDPGKLLTLNTNAPRILYPVHGSTVTDSTLRFETSYSGSPFDPSLSQGILSQGSAFVTTINYTWFSPPVPLLPGLQYMLDAYSIATLTRDFGFTRPVDGDGQSLSGGWTSRGRLQYEAISRFRTIPEPGTLTTAAVALIALAGYASHKRRNRKTTSAVN